MTRLLGLDFADLDLEAALAMLAARPARAPFGYLVTPNADHLVRLARDPARHAPLYAGASWRLLDSRVVARLARALGLPAPPVVPGSDLAAALFARILAPGEAVSVLGGSARMAATLGARHGLALVHHDPPMGFDADAAAFEAALRFVEASGARFHFLCVGSPRQEMVAQALGARGRARGTALCVGSALRFIAGEERRAPRAMQRAGLEWAWRLAQDPRRLARRYLLEDPAILALLWRERSALRRAGGG